MLKIKDGIDLKELEKFGFKGFTENDNPAIVEYVYSYGERNRTAWIRIYGDDILPWNKYTFSRKIMLMNHTQKTYDKLYDLISAGLVEKVDEK